jgi:predicted phosphodiesterase
VKKVTRHVFASDQHWPNIHEPTWRVFKKWLADEEVDEVIIGGDFLDFASLSRYSQEVGQKQAVLDDIKEFVREANALLQHCKSVIILEGNHDGGRWYKKILEPIALQIPGLVGLTLQEQCRFQGLHKSIKWRNEGLEWRGHMVGNMIARHGDKQSPRFGSANPARAALVRTLGRSQIFGHTHQSGMVAMGTHRGTCVSVANPHMSDEHSYSLENNWVRGWTLIEVDTATKFAHPYPIIVEDGRLAWRGKLYVGK